MRQRTVPLPRPVPPVLIAGLNARLATCLEPAIQARLSLADPATIEINYPEGGDEAVILAQVKAITDSFLKGAQFFDDYHPEVLSENPVAMLRPTPDLAELLVRRGDITFLEGGMPCISGHFLAVMDRFDEFFLKMALADGARPCLYPDLLPLPAAERSGYIDGFLDQATFAATAQRNVFLMNDLLQQQPRNPSAYRQSLGDPEYLFIPALCYNVYLHFGGKKLNEDQFLVIKGRCCRQEAVTQPDLLRLRNFTVRELVYIGEEEAVESWRRNQIEQVFEMARRWGLRCRVVQAHDPFFVREHAARTLFQLTRRVKYELTGEIPGSPDELAISSFNLHGEHFTRAFGITREERYLHSACVGFGLERWAACFLAQQGPDALPENT